MNWTRDVDDASDVAVGCRFSVALFSLDSAGGAGVLEASFAGLDDLRKNERDGFAGGAEDEDDDLLLSVDLRTTFLLFSVEFSLLGPLFPVCIGAAFGSFGVTATAGPDEAFSGGRGLLSFFEWDAGLGAAGGLGAIGVVACAAVLAVLSSCSIFPSRLFFSSV